MIVVLEYIAHASVEAVRGAFHKRVVHVTNALLIGLFGADLLVLLEVRIVRGFLFEPKQQVDVYLCRLDHVMLPNNFVVKVVIFVFEGLAKGF